MGFKKPSTVEIVFKGKTKRVRAGTQIVNVMPANKNKKGFSYLGAVANNRLVSLTAPLWTRTELRLVTVTEPFGAAIYRRCATYLLFAAFSELYPRWTLEIGQSMGNGYFFRILGNKGKTPNLKKLTDRIQSFVAENLPFEHQELTVDQATLLFEKMHQPDKVRLLRVWPSGNVHLVSLRNFVDIYHGPVALDAGSIDDFSLIEKSPGFVLHFSALRSPVWRKEAWCASDRLFETYQETRQWNEILGVNTVGDLNDLCLNGGVLDIMRIAEGFHEKKTAEIADQVRARDRKVKIVLIAGPSSSGKTTFSKRLSIQLRVNGIKPVTLSLDNYYVNREDTPRHPDGSYDFEAIDAIDIELFNDHLLQLLDGKTVHTPKFDFTLGVRVPKEKWKPLQLHDDQVLMIEGIHGLNDRLTHAIPNELKFRIFVSALTQLIIDNANRVATSDARLIRRIVRDRRYRGYSAAETIATWRSVRRGEQRNIFPFQDRCDVLFNSALVYEPAVLKVLADRYLLEVPRNHPSAAIAHALQKFLQLFVPIFPNDVPRSSILREFIGGSSFKY